MWSVLACGGRDAPPVETGSSCTNCRIDLTRIVSLGGDSTGYVDKEPIAMTRDWRGRYYLTFFSPPQMIPVFDSTGRPLFRIGRKGQGPGEYQAPIQIRALPDRRFLVFDFGGVGKMSVLDSSYRFIRSYTQVVAPVVFLPDSRTTGNFGPLTLFDTLGRAVKTFGAPTEPPIDAQAWRGNRKEAPGAGATIWSIRDDTYHIEQWDTAGKRVADIVRTVEWFPPVVNRAVIRRGERPTPQTRDLYEDPRGLLWVVITVASADWHDHLGPPVTRTGLVSGTTTTTYPQLDDGRMHDSMIEVIDPKTQRLVATTRFAGLMLFSLGDRYFASYREAENGIPFVDVWRLRLVGDR